MDNKEVICVVCFANYCRSPVAETILKRKLGKRYKVISAGLQPVAKAEMDKRSQRFLSENGYSLEIHTPKKISKNIITKCKYIFALDPMILIELNKLYPGNFNKIKLLSFQKKGVNLFDPIGLDENEYKTVMKNIEAVCSEILI